MATHAHITRRTLAATLAALPAAAVAAPLADAGHEQDAELHRLFREWEAAVEASKWVQEHFEDPTDDEAAEVYGRESDLQTAIVKHPARSLADLKLKARVALHAGGIHIPRGSGTLVDRLMHSEGPASENAAAFAVVCDLLQLAGDVTA